MSSVPADPVRLTGTDLAQHFRFGCDRRLRWLMEPDGGELGIPAEAPAPAGALLRAAGRRFERRAVARLLRRHGPGRVLMAAPRADGSPGTLAFERVREALGVPGELRWIVQPELRLVDTAAFARRFGIPAGVEIAPAVPDLLRVGRDRAGRIVVGVGDIKWSRAGRIPHRAQVAYYTLVLEEACRAAGVELRVDARRGWLWTRGAGRPRPFPLASYRHHVERFLRDDLGRIAASSPGGAAWHTGRRCASCGFLGHCTAEAERTDHLSRVVGMGAEAARLLRDRGIATVGALRRSEFRAGVYAGSESLERDAAVLKKRVQALDYGRIKEGDRTRWVADGEERQTVLLVADVDPVSGTVFALGARFEPGPLGRASEGLWISESGDAAGEAALLAGFLAWVAAEAADGAGIRAHVWSRREAALLASLLQRHLHGLPALAGLGAAAGVLLPGAGAPLPLEVVEDEVARRFALPIAHAWDLASVSALLRPARGAHVHAPPPDAEEPFDGGIAVDRIHGLRGPGIGARERAARRDAIAALVRSRVAGLGSVVRALAEARLRASPAGAPLRVTSPAPSTPLADATLEVLRLFTLAEAAAEATAVRDLHALPTAERARRGECIAGLELVEVDAEGHAIFAFDPASRDSKLRPGDLALLLSNDDDGRTLAASDAMPWVRRRLSVELVGYDLAADPPRLTLASERGWDRLAGERREGRPLLDLGRRAVLDRGGADWSTRRVLATLAALDAAEGEAAFVLRALSGEIPADWLRPLDAERAWREVIAPAAAALGRPILDADQEAAWRAPFERAISVFWGPPGTGKTYLLAWTLLGLAAAARRDGRPLRVLVTASTHRAIANVLVRVAGEAAAVAGAPRVVKLAGRGSEADAELAAAGVELVADDGLAAVLADPGAAGATVVGATVWSVWKRMRAEGGGEHPVLPLFDLVVIDEASQMRVPEALVALSALRRGGRVILAGDDRQLSPILRGRYEPDRTLLGSAFAHFAAHFGRLPLRRSRRMNDALVRWPRRLFYPGYRSADPGRRLLVAPAPATGEDALDAALRDAFLRPDEPAVLCTYDGYAAGVRNPLEACLAARIATIARRGMLDPETGERYEAGAFRHRGLAILSPHRAQNAAILAQLLAAGWARDELPVVDTVERMQGNEREAIIVSYGVADRERAAAEAEFLLDPHRFNVSITRARSKLVVLLSEAVLRTLPADERVMDAAAAVQGYPGHLGPVLRELEVPAPGGGAVLLQLRAARAGGG